jgi:hypothetical protein
VRAPHEERHTGEKVKQNQHRALLFSSLQP